VYQKHPLAINSIPGGQLPRNGSWPRLAPIPATPEKLHQAELFEKIVERNRILSTGVANRPVKRPKNKRLPSRCG
jgi:hypothetical protein